MATLTDQELEKILDILFIHLQKKGLFPVGVDKKQVITNVLNSLKTAISGNISAETLRERSFQRLLGLALVNSALLRSPQLTAKFIDILLHKYKKMSVAEMKTKLRVFLRAINGLQPANKQLNDDQLNKLVELIAANLLKFSQKENEKTPTPTYNDPLTET
ncbi:MAG TPA: hypothetical protein VJL60_02285, partial [Gammaproteobacteria bacterium]|nr:hypothetical protein [Gammaproteobacteria bacterium]